MSNTEITLDISTLWRIFKKHALIVIAFSVATTVFAVFLSEGILTKKYAATAKFYIENRQTQEIMSINDINTAKNIVNTCIELFSTYNITDRLREVTGVNYDVDRLRDMISMSVANNTEFLLISVTTDDAKEAVSILSSFVDICIDEFNDVIGSGKIKVVDPAIASQNPVFPNTKIFTAVGFLSGFILTYLFVFVAEIFDTKVKAEDDLFLIYDIPVFAEILNFEVSTKGEYGYEYK